MTAPHFAPVDDDTADLLSLVAEDAGYAEFLRICKHVADNNDGIVSVQKVRDLVRSQGIEFLPRTYSAYWSRSCRKGGPMVTTMQWDVCTDRAGKNSGKPQRLRRWVA